MNSFKKKEIKTYYKKLFQKIAHSPLSNRNSKDEISSPPSSHPRPIESTNSLNAAPSITITPPQTPPTNSILSQPSLPSTAPGLHKPPSERNSYNRRSYLPSSTLLQVIETEEEKELTAPVRDYYRKSFSSYESTISSVSSTWEGINNEMIELTSERELNKCAGYEYEHLYPHSYLSMLL